MNRRTYMLVGASSLVGGAGCLASGEQVAQLAWINLKNHRETAHDVEVTVEEDGEMLFSDTYTLGTEPDTANVVIEDAVEGEGQYTVHSTMDGEDRTVETTEFVDGEEICVGVIFELLDNGSVNYRTKSMQQC